MNTLRIPMLWGLQGVFLLRVLAQLEVVLVEPIWLPPMGAWYSGLIPYPILLPVQIGILMWMTIISYDNTRRAGLFFVQSPRVRGVLVVISTAYFAMMLARYLLTMVLHPESRWLGGVIPILFHWVLAAYIGLLAANSESHANSSARLMMPIIGCGSRG